MDWRAPIASVYYDGKIGKNSYKCPEGIVDIDLALKRIYSIERGGKKLVDDYIKKIKKYKPIEIYQDVLYSEDLKEYVS